MSGTFHGIRFEFGFGESVEHGADRRVLKNLCAYLLFLNGIVPEDAVMDAHTLPHVVMPNHAGFTSPDPRPDVFNTDGEPPVGTPPP